MYKFQIEFLIAFLFTFLGCFAQEFYHQPAYLGINDYAGIERDLKDARSVSINRIKPRQKQIEIPFEPAPKSKGRTVVQEKKITAEVTPKTPIAHDNQFLYDSKQRRKADETDKNYIKKMADQLDIAHKHVSLLSEHQKYILRQDPLVESYVFGNRGQETRRSKSKIFQTGQSPRHEIESFSYSGNGKNEKSSKTSANQETKEINQSQYVTTPSPSPPSTPPPPQQRIAYFQDINNLPPGVASGTIPQPHFQHGFESNRIPQAISHASPISQFNAGTFPIHQVHEKNRMNDFNQATSVYEFLYNINDFQGNGHFGREESQYYDATNRKYFLQLPDGQFKTVNYWPENTGYNSNVEYVRSAIHPHHY